MNILAEIQPHFIQPDMEAQSDRVPDTITKLFYVNWILEQSSNPIDEIMFLISLIEDETKNHKEKVKTLQHELEWRAQNDS